MYVHRDKAFDESDNILILQSLCSMRRGRRWLLSSNMELEAKFIVNSLADEDEITSVPFYNRQIASIMKLVGNFLALSGSKSIVFNLGFD